MTENEKITQKLRELGFTAYEAMTYISLLENNPVTRYELSKNSGVPRSAIYSVIQKLENIGAVNAQYTKPEKYIPLPPEQLFELLERQFRSKIEAARKSLKDFETQLVPDHLWNIVGYDNMILKTRELIQKSKKSIYLSVWARELKLLERDLSDAIDRGVEVLVFSFTDHSFNLGKVYCYGLLEKELEKIWAHKIILISDKNELIMGEADNLKKKKTVWTTNRALIDIATNHIILDVTIFGIRMQKETRQTAAAMQNGETAYLGQLLKQKNPKILF